jgi:DNA primase
MIKGKKKVKLTSDAILERINEYDIFRFYMPDKTWKLNQVTHSPFRKENNPSFLIGTRKGYVSFVDFADTSKRGDCFTFVKLLYNLSTHDDVLKLIDKDFGLGIASGAPTEEYKKIVATYKQPELTKRNALIQVVTRKFTKSELDYWNQYHQSVDDLRANNVYAIKKLFLNKSLFYIKETELAFGYLYEGHWKIYRPYADRNNKWLSNVPLTTSWGLNNLNKDKNTLICKSLKDYMVCRKVYKNVCGVQNESIAAFSEDTVNRIKDSSKIVFYGGDSDRPGKEASFAITEAFGFKHINPPDRLLPKIKDFADWAKAEGLESLVNHFKQKQLL